MMSVLVAFGRRLKRKVLGAAVFRRFPTQQILDTVPFTREFKNYTVAGKAVPYRV
ncbi:MAG: hypothetical protein LBJ00_16345 [Planctomycetaceae bacterium]|nr:hypothetical protein [Planctomycetaceae bacterium]